MTDHGKGAAASSRIVNFSEALEQVNVTQGQFGKALDAVLNSLHHVDDYNNPSQRIHAANAEKAVAKLRNENEILSLRVSQLENRFASLEDSLSEMKRTCRRISFATQHGSIASEEFEMRKDDEEMPVAGGNATSQDTESAAINNGMVCEETDVAIAGHQLDSVSPAKAASRSAVGAATEDANNVSFGQRKLRERRHREGAEINALGTIYLDPNDKRQSADIYKNGPPSDLVPKAKKVSQRGLFNAIQSQRDMRGGGGGGKIQDLARPSPELFVSLDGTITRRSYSTAQNGNQTQTQLSDSQTMQGNESPERRLLPNIIESTPSPPKRFIPAKISAVRSASTNRFGTTPSPLEELTEATAPTPFSKEEKNLYRSDWNSYGKPNGMSLDEFTRQQKAVIPTPRKRSRSVIPREQERSGAKRIREANIVEKAANDAESFENANAPDASSPSSTLGNGPDAQELLLRFGASRRG